MTRDTGSILCKCGANGANRIATAVLKHQKQKQVTQAGRKAVSPHTLRGQSGVVCRHSTCKETVKNSIWYLSFCCRSSCNAAPRRFTLALCSRAFRRWGGRWAVKLLPSALPQASGGPKMSPRAEVLLPNMRLSLPAYTTKCVSSCREHAGWALGLWQASCRAGKAATTGRF